MRHRSRHVVDLLPAFVVGTLGPEDKRRVTDHLRTCTTCESELASWKMVNGAVHVAYEAYPAPSAQVMDRVWDEIEEGSEVVVTERGEFISRMYLAWQLLLGQIPLVRKSLWAASALMMLLGSVVAIVTSGPTFGGQVVAALAPVVAAAGVAFIYGSDNDASLEVTLATPTSPRVILLARLTLVFGYDLSLAVAADTALLAFGAEAGLWSLISLWLGPMLFLSSLALVTSLLLDSATAALCVMSLWVAKLVISSEAGTLVGLSRLAETMDVFWQSTATLSLLAWVLLGIVLVYFRLQERLV